jgi:hypothetical protein
MPNMPFTGSDAPTTAENRPTAARSGRGQGPDMAKDVRHASVVVGLTFVLAAAAGVAFLSCRQHPTDLSLGGGALWFNSFDIGQNPSAGTSGWPQSLLLGRVDGPRPTAAVAILGPQAPQSEATTLSTCRGAMPSG